MGIPDKTGFARTLYQLIIVTFLLQVYAGSEIIGDLRARSTDPILQTGEFLKYAVSWYLLQVGTLDIINTGLTNHRGKEGHLVHMRVLSNPNIRIVNAHMRFETIIDTNFITLHFRGRHIKREHTVVTEYDFDYEDTKKVYITMYEQYEPDGNTNVFSNAVLPLLGPCRDNTALLFYARALAQIPRSNFNVEVISFNQSAQCRFFRTGEKKTIGWRNTQTDTAFLEGKLLFETIIGVRDNFHGWFSADAASVPLRARLKAFFGYIDIDLESVRN